MDPRHYTVDEYQVIRQYYPDHGHVWIGWRDVLPSRTPESIRRAAARIGVSKGRYTKEQEAVIESCYPSFGNKWGGWKYYFPKQNYQSVQAKAIRNGICRMRAWTPLEDKLLLFAVKCGMDEKTVAKEMEREPWEIGRRIEALKYDRRYREMADELPDS